MDEHFYPLQKEVLGKVCFWYLIMYQNRCRLELFQFILSQELLPREQLCLSGGSCLYLSRPELI